MKSSSLVRSRRFYVLLFVLTIFILASVVAHQSSSAHRELLLSSSDSNAGDLDASFGNNGRVTYSSTDEFYSDVALQPDGKIVAVGCAASSAAPRLIFLIRYRADGSLDTSFGSGGKVSTLISNRSVQIIERPAVAVQADGKIVVMSRVDSPIPNSDHTTRDFLLARYNTDGSLDTSFGNGGAVTTNFTGQDDSGNMVHNHDEPHNLVIQPNGKIIVVGETYNSASSSPRFAIARYNTDGSLDASFGDGGRQFSRNGVNATAVALQSNGKIIVAGIARGASFIVERYHPGGSLDTSFGNDGVMTFRFEDFDISGQFYTDNPSLTIQPDDKIILGCRGSLFSPGGALVRLNRNGGFDTSFGNNGRAVNNFGGVSSRSFGEVALDSAGRIIVGGSINSAPALMRFYARGVPDAEFGSGGFVTTEGTGSVVIQPDGKVISASRSRGLSMSRHLMINQVATPAGENVTVQSEIMSITFNGVSKSGTTSINFVDPSLLAPLLPPGYTTFPGAPAYQLTTTAEYTPPITICVNVLSVNDPTFFSTVRFLHGEGNRMVDRTILPPDSPTHDFDTRRVCGRVTSFSPFVIAQGDSAASLSISGRVSDNTGSGVADVTITLSGSPAGTTQTNSNGNYSIGGLAAGGNYTVTPSKQGYTFAPASLTFNGLSASHTTADFTAASTTPTPTPTPTPSPTPTPTPSPVNTLLHLPLDGSLTGSDGETPTQSSGVTFEPGIRGQGALIEGTDILRYATVGNFHAAEGTIEFWVKPQWNGNSATNNCFFGIGNSPYTANSIVFEKDGAGNLGYTVNTPHAPVPFDVRNWVAGQWHHVALTWSYPGHVRLYVDGTERFSRASVSQDIISTVAQTMTIGSLNTIWQANAVLDEFRISGVARTATEVQQNFMSGLTVNSLTMQLPLTEMYPTWEKTPTLTAETNVGTLSIPPSGAAWSSSAPQVATVDGAGKITAVAPGQVTITATLNGAQAQITLTIKAPARPRENLTVNQFLATPAANHVYELPVVVVAFLPTADGTTLDPATAPTYASSPPSLTTMRQQVERDAMRTKFTLEEGSRFRGYANPGARPSLGVRVVDFIVVYEPTPQGPASATGTGLPIYRPDYHSMFRRLNAERYVNELGVKEFWIYDPILDSGLPFYNPGIHREEYFRESPESNMSSPLTGDISNSRRDPNDLPVYDRTYTVFSHYIGRLGLGSGHVRGHQLEAILAYIDGRQSSSTLGAGSVAAFDRGIAENASAGLAPDSAPQPQEHCWRHEAAQSSARDRYDEHVGPLNTSSSGTLFWRLFVGQNESGSFITGRSGWTHMPPNTTQHYDYRTNNNLVESDIRDWRPAGGQRTPVNAATWGNIAYQWPEGTAPLNQEDRNETHWYIFWMQSMPGLSNFIPHGQERMTNWWAFTGDWDGSIRAQAGLYGPASVATAARFSAASHNVTEDAGHVQLTVTRVGDTSGVATLDYATANGTASERTDYTLALGTLRFAPGETQKLITVLVTDDLMAEGNETFTVALSNPVGLSLTDPATATVTIIDNDTISATNNPVDDARFFARQHYLDFLNRQPDEGGWDFWTNDILACLSQHPANSPALAFCIEDKRNNVSAAFFLSIEFQQTGYLVYRFYRASFPDSQARPRGFPRYREFMRDAQEIGRGVVVGPPSWDTQLEANKQAFALAWVQRAEFVSRFPTSLTAEQFVDQLFQTTGLTPSAVERQAAIAEFNNAEGGLAGQRARSLRRVAENERLVAQEFNRAFVLMQYFGYLRRNPDEAPDTDFGGYDFWLGKLNEFNGNFIRSQMVLAFISSIEYRNRFGQ